MIYYENRGGPGAVVKAACLESAGSSLALALMFQENKMLLARSLVKIQYCGESPWPRGSVLGLRPPGHEFWILCLYRQCHLIHLTILRRFSWPSLAYMCTKVPKTTFISFHLYYENLIYVCTQYVKWQSPESSWVVWLHWTIIFTLQRAHLCGHWPYCACEGPRMFT